MKDGAARAKKYQARAKQIRSIAMDVRSKADRKVHRKGAYLLGSRLIFLGSRGTVFHVPSF